MARRGQALTISLFSFQDIITSVSGILIFITLMLVLELIQAVEGNPASRVTRDLEAASTQAERERSRLKQELRRSADDLVDALDADSADSLVSRNELEASSRSLEGEIEALDARAKEAKLREDRADAQEFASRDEKAERDKLREEVQEIKEQIEREKSEDRIYYAAGESSGRERWLVDLGNSSISVALLGHPRPPTIFRGEATDTGDPALEQFLRWANAEARDAYLLILVRPEACKRFATIESEMLSSNRQFGFDLIGQDRKVIDEKTGAAPP